MYVHRRRLLLSRSTIPIPIPRWERFVQKAMTLANEPTRETETVSEGTVWWTIGRLLIATSSVQPQRRRVHLIHMEEHLPTI